MLFNSYNFLLIFLPIFFFLNYISNEIFNKKNFLLVIIFSFIFYSFDNYNFTILLLLSIIFNYIFAKKIDDTKNIKIKKIYLFLIILFNIFILAYFKYYNFFINNINYLRNEKLNLISLALPLAISFFTFQQISFQIDNFKKSLKKNFLTYFLYVSFFPQLIAGPIIRYSYFFKESVKKNFLSINPQNLSIGLTIILIGLFKKIILADTLGIYVDNFYIKFNNGSEFSSIDSALFIIFFSIQIYFDFSAYCDIAVGIGKIIDFNIPINFNSPYKSKSIIEFWKKWHITLSQFFRDYFYIALGGNKNNFVIKIIIITFVMTVCGLWHGASNNFVFWGLLHGVIISLNHVINKFDILNLKKIPDFVKIIFTFSLVSILFVFFRVPNIPQSFEIILSLFDYSNYFNNSIFINEISLINKIIMFSSLLIVFFAPNIFQIFDLKHVNINKIERNNLIKFKTNLSWLVLNLILIVIIILNLGRPSTFIYFHF
jgi:alginate O-acetyltransferase complex protein AlgI